MSKRWQKADIILKALLTLVGLILGVAIAYRSWSEDAERHREARRESLKEEFRTFYGYVRAADGAGRSAKSDADLASAAAQSLSSDFGLPIYSTAINQLRLDRISAPGERRALNLQVWEAGSATEATADGSQWFTVIASYDLSDFGRKEAEAQRERLRTANRCTEIWATKTSRSYALVLGGAVSRDIALARAQEARQNGLAPDAFTQVNRQWTQNSDPC
jgi:hypothetical protein